MKQNMLALAIKLVAEGFLNVEDKGGNPYFLHCYRVAQPFIGVDDELAQAALLHDALEDGIFKSVQEIADYGFSYRVQLAIVSCTHLLGEDYDVYIKRLAVNEDARKIKLNDLIDNSNIMRLKGLRKKDFDRLEKYFKAYEYLKF